jgi:hypothetical protein
MPNVQSTTRAAWSRHPREGIDPMLKFKRLLLVAATVAALTLALAPAAAASSKTFYLAKTCAADASEPLGFVCTVTHSTKWIPPGTDIHYAAIPPLTQSLCRRHDQDRQRQHQRRCVLSSLG